MSSLFRSPPKTPKPPTPAAPIPTPDTGDIDKMVKRFMRPTRGRESTILTGDLIPMSIGKRQLLG